MIDKTQVIKRWNDGATMAKIADEMDCTRSAVAGVVDRMRKQGEMVKRHEPERPKPVPKQVAVPLLKHTDSMCRMIISKPGEAVLYCAKLRTVHAYCDEHAQGKYLPIRPRDLRRW